MASCPLPLARSARDRFGEPGIERGGHRTPGLDQPRAVAIGRELHEPGEPGVNRVLRIVRSRRGGAGFNQQLPEQRPGVIERVGDPRPVAGVGGGDHARVVEMEVGEHPAPMVDAGVLSRADGADVFGAARGHVVRLDPHEPRGFERRVAAGHVREGGRQGGEGDQASQQRGGSAVHDQNSRLARLIPAITMMRKTPAARIPGCRGVTRKAMR